MGKETDVKGVLGLCIFDRKKQNEYTFADSAREPLNIVYIIGRMYPKVKK